MTGILNNLSLEGQTGSEVEGNLNVLLSTVRNSLRLWEAGFDGSACHLDGAIYLLRSGGDPTIQPDTVSGFEEWANLSVGLQGATGPAGSSVPDSGYSEAGVGNTSFFVREVSANGFMYFAVAKDDATINELEMLLTTVGSEAVFQLNIRTTASYHDPGIAHHYADYQRVYVEDKEYVLQLGATLAQKQANPSDAGAHGGAWVETSGSNGGTWVET